MVGGTIDEWFGSAEVGAVERLMQHRQSWWHCNTVEGPGRCGLSCSHTYVLALGQSAAPLLDVAGSWPHSIGQCLLTHKHAA